MAAPHSPPPGLPRFGVAALILDAEGKLLVGQRFGSHGAGSWQLPGGHLEEDEGLLAAAARETKEETGLDVEARCVVVSTYDVFERERKHYVTLFVLCARTDPNATPEPEKCPQWLWKSTDELLRLNLFLPLSNLLRRPLGLAAVIQGAGPVVRLAPDAGPVTIRWDLACVGGCQLADDVLTVPPGRDIAIVDSSPRNVNCRLDTVVAVDDPEAQEKTVEWPLGSDLVLLSFRDSNGVEHQAESLLELCVK